MLDLTVIFSNLKMTHIPNRQIPFRSHQVPATIQSIPLIASLGKDLSNPQEISLVLTISAGQSDPGMASEEEEEDSVEEWGEDLEEAVSEVVLGVVSEVGQ